jgi:hypothetical protein
MYAKLVVGASNILAMRAMRDIARLCTSSDPTTSLLGGFSAASSVIIDNTPAGWTYVGSNNASDRPTIAAVGVTGYAANDTQCNLVMSAPCIEGSVLKYASLNLSHLSSVNATSNNTFNLTGAVSATALGVLTNEGPRYSSATTTTATNTNNTSVLTTAGTVIHVIATPRFITIVSEGRGMQSVWEASMSDVNRFYNTAPFIQHCHSVSSIFTSAAIVVPTATTSAITQTVCSAAFGVTDVNTGTFYGTYDTSGVTNSFATLNIGSLNQINASLRKNSITLIGSPCYQVTPIFFQLGALGHPIQTVSGVTPAYWTSGNIGTTGDTLEINGDLYNYFNCGTGFGLALKTN